MIVGYMAMSPSDPSKRGMLYFNEKGARDQVLRMDKLLKEWETNPIWNKEYWKTKPEPWKVYSLTILDVI